MLWDKDYRIQKQCKQRIQYMIYTMTEVELQS